MHTFSSQQIFFLEKIPGRIKSADFFGQYAKKCKTVQLSNAETEVECPHTYTLSQHSDASFMSHGTHDLLDLC